MSRHLLIAGAALAALSLSACNKASEPTAPPAEKAAVPDAAPAATIPTPANEAAAPDFVAKAAASDMFEIEAAKLAQARSKNADVKAFAQMMTTAHTKSTADLKKAISDANQAITPPATLPQPLQDKLADLSKVDAAGFDKAYMSGQVDAHQDTLNLMQRYAQDGDVAQIKAFATATGPVVQTHLDRAKVIRDALK